ncbi:MAG: M1 family aminopeptidase [Terriglobales bacterium]
MQSARESLGRAFSVVILVLLAFTLAGTSQTAEKQRIRVDDYVIDAELAPKTHRLIGRAQVKFTALDDITVATFELHNALRLTKVLDAAGHTLSAERVTQDSTIRVVLPAGLAKNASTTLTFYYDGLLQSADDSPVQGLKLASVSEETSYLLYAGRWFPVAGFGTNRFTAIMNVTVPSGYEVIASGNQSAGSTATAAAAAAPAPDPPQRGRTKQRKPSKATPAPPPVLPAVTGGKTYRFVWSKPGFPGTVIVGHFQKETINSGGMNVLVYFKPKHKDLVSLYAETAAKELDYFTAQYGPPESTTLKLVELPDDTVTSTWAPEIAAVASRAITPKGNYRLLANTIAHQWWGESVSPATRDDWWISDGFARYSEARYVEHAAGQAGFNEAVKDIAVGALAYDQVPLARVSTLELYSPEFQSLVTDKGAMILHMLRWVIGDAAFNRTLTQFAQQYHGKPARIDDFQQIAEKNYGSQLTWFFTQWLDSTGAPAFKNKYTIYRTPKGFRVVGEISQDLDLFRMPVELKIDTDGKTEMKRIEVVGTNSAYSVDTFGKPRKITIDPDNWVLENSPDLKVRTSILRGQQLVQQGDLAQALEEFQKALATNSQSSLAHYRIAEVFFMQRNYQAAANAYRDALNGDGEPRWTEVWSHIQLGKIFDLTGQRERATNEYRQALQTNDNTQGAMDEARRYLQTPYQRSRYKEGD